MSRGAFIVFEGIDGAGKSTQITRLAEWMRADGRTVHLTAEPTSSETGKALRAALSGTTPRTAAEMAAPFTLDRIGHNSEINALLDKGIDVVCDRYYYSSLAYQGSICDYEWVRHMNCECPDIRKPDLCIFLDLSPDAALARIASRGESAEIYETKDTLERVRNTFLGVFDSLPDRVRIIDASGTPDEVADAVIRAATELF